MLPQEKLKYTLDDYIELEKTSEERLEFWDGNVWSMSGASLPHNQVQGNIYFALRLKLRGKGCNIFSSDMRVKVPAYLPYRYPDISALCGEANFEKLKGLDVLTNPQLIVEILSDSTEAFDRGDKFTYYKSIESFIEYLLVAQHRPHVTQYVKQADNSWSYKEVNELSEKIYVASLDCELNLEELYRDVIFPSDVLPFQRGEFAE
ncbi:MAG TPA: Uma2 family endonuclease [Pyrinomonadaceae bacterium]|nr:Uma2 family endonuclease [Pyrinomonadaceae bacterium]